MASFKGIVEQVSITETLDACCLKLRGQGSPSTAFLMLWSYPTSDSSAEARLRHSMWLSLARDALTNNKTVYVTYPTGGSLVNGFTIYA